ncbi:MAG: SGNH/GDSL hydrolase family protein [Kiritimatiellaeota bacterium]|nr:SGNH/GDSL hydrolase family protein [Kiritimatiellota bacterium]
MRQFPKNLFRSFSFFCGISIILFCGCISGGGKSGEKAQIAAILELQFDAPELFGVLRNFAPPFGDFGEACVDGYMWPGAQGLMPRYDDEDGSIILGGAFRQVVPESLEITSTNGARLYIERRDFRLNREWGQIIAIDGRLGTEPVCVKASLAMQRIDLVQRGADGALAVKKGVSRLVCPRRPAPDEGYEAVAGVYIAPWRRGSVWTVTREDIFLIDAKRRPAPAPNRNAVINTRAKLDSGMPVSVAFVGDSITLGAEAGQWWSDDSATYRGRVMRELRARFPRSRINEVQAFQGGKGIEYIVETFDTLVAPFEPDLVIIGIGVNDAHERAPLTGEPVVAIEKFTPLFAELLGKCAAIGAEVVIHTSMQTNPFDANGDAARWGAYRTAMMSAAARRRMGVADTYAAWNAQSSDGIPPFSQLHNWINHPGADGHKIFADEILRYFQ